MKKVFTSVVAMLFFFAFISETKAAPIATYYVTNNEDFTLEPLQTGLTGLTKLLWKIDAIPTETETLPGTNGGRLTLKFNDAANTITTHTIKLSVLGDLGSCLSDLIEYEIIVLPQLEVTLASTDPSNFCQGGSVSAVLNASIKIKANGAALSTLQPTLDALGVTVPFIWKKGTDVIAGAITSAYTATETGVFSALCEYKFPASGQPHASGGLKDVNLITGSLARTIQQTLTIPTVPSIKLL